MDKYNKSVQHQWFHHATWGDSKYKNEGIGEVLWHSLTEDGKVEVVNIKFGNKTYENVSVKHLNPTDESHHSHKRTGKELKKKKVKEGMIKLKQLLKESFARKFGEPLATLDSVMKDYELGKLYTDIDKPPFKTEKQIEEEKLNEAPEHELARELNKATDVILRLIKIYGKKADVEGMTRSWMMGLHAKLKKAGIKIWLN